MPWAGICVCVYGVGGCWETGAFSLFHLSKPQRIFFCIPSQLVTRAVTLSVTSRCVTLRQLRSGMPPQTNNKSQCERSAGERGSHWRAPPPQHTPNPTQPLRPPHSFSYSRVQFSESYLGYYSNPYPHQRTPTSGQKNSCYQLGHSIGRRATVWGCPPWFSASRRRVWQTKIDRCPLPSARRRQRRKHRSDLRRWYVTVEKAVFLSRCQTINKTSNLNLL